MRSLNPELQKNMLKRAHTVMDRGASSIVDQVVSAALSDKSKAESPLSGALVRALVLGTKPEGYAAACRALASASDPEYGRIEAETLVVAGASTLPAQVSRRADAHAGRESTSSSIQLSDPSRRCIASRPPPLRSAGEFDYLSDAETTSQLCEQIPRARRVQMDRVGHWHAVEDPVGLRRVLEEFLL